MERVKRRSRIASVHQLQLLAPLHSETSSTAPFTILEVCAGAGGQALGYEQAGFEHAGLVELDKIACTTLRLNRPKWNVICQDLNEFSGSAFKGVDIITGGLP